MPIHTLAADSCDAAFAFLDAAVSRRGRQHWRWKYRLGDAREPSAFYWEEADGRVVGFIGMMRTQLHAGLQSSPAAWFVDWYVTPGEHAVGVGLGLLRKAEAAAGALLTLQGSPDTHKLLPRLGWRQSASPVTWVRPLSTRFVAVWLGRRMPPGGVATRLAAALLSSYFRARRPAAYAGMSLVDVDRFPLAYDTVWQRRAPEFAPAMARASDYLNYLCADYPENGYRLQLLQDRGEPIGHVILRVDEDRAGFRRGRLVDVVWPRRRVDLAMWLLQHAAWRLHEAGADYIECVASVADLSDVLQRERFSARRPVPIWYHRLPQSAADPEQWYITFLDCDRAYR